MRPEALLLLGALAAPVGAEEAGGLWGRTILVRIETWDDPETPLLRSRDYVGRVGPGPEFDVTAEVWGALGVVPVAIDLAAGRIDLSYGGTAPGVFTNAVFNGFVLSFPAECALLTGAAVDPSATTLPLTDVDLRIEPQGLQVNVAGLAHGPADRIGIRLEVTDCALS